MIPTEMVKCMANDQLYICSQKKKKKANNNTIQSSFDFHLTKLEHGNIFPVETWLEYAEKRNSERENVLETEEAHEENYPKESCSVRDYWEKKECC